MGEIIRRTKNGKFLGYYLRWYEAGRRRQRASKQATHADARRMLIEIEARVARGEVGIIERAAPSATVAEIVEKFVAEYDRPKVKDAARYRRQARSVLKRVLPSLGSQRADQVKPADIARLRTALNRSWAPGSVKLTLNILSSAFSWAVRESLAPANPCRGVERPSVSHAIDFLSREELRRLLDAAAADSPSSVTAHMLQICIATAIYTGLRKGEILGLRWQDVDLKTRRLTIARSYRGAPKSGKPRHLRLPAVLVPLLERWREVCPASPSGSIIPIGRGADRVASPRTMLGLPRLWERVGLRKLSHPWHVLRHSFASHFVMSGGNILALQKILGHADLKMTLVYAHLAPDFLEGEMDRLVL